MNNLSFNGIAQELQAGFAANPVDILWILPTKETVQKFNERIQKQLPKEILTRISLWECPSPEHLVLSNQAWSRIMSGLCELLTSYKKADLQKLV